MNSAAASFAGCKTGGCRERAGGSLTHQLPQCCPRPWEGSCLTGQAAGLGPAGGWGIPHRPWAMLGDPHLTYGPRRAPPLNAGVCVGTPPQGPAQGPLPPLRPCTGPPLRSSHYSRLCLGPSFPSPALLRSPLTPGDPTTTLGPAWDPSPGPA